MRNAGMLRRSLIIVLAALILGAAIWLVPPESRKAGDAPAGRLGESLILPEAPPGSVDRLPWWMLLAGGLAAIAVLHGIFELTMYWTASGLAATLGAQQ